MTSNIDRSLDEIIKEQKKAKRQQQQKQKKPTQKVKGKAKPTTARQGKVVRKRGQNLKQQTSRQTGPPSRTRKNAAGKQIRKGKTRVQANPLKNRQSMGSKLVKKARKTQANAAQNRVNRRQAQQKQTRQNQMNRRRGIQTNQLQRKTKEAKVQSRQFQGGNKNRNRNRPVLKRPSKDLMLTVNISNPRANSRLGTLQGTARGLGRRRRWRQSGDRMGTGVATSNFNLAASRQELRVSVANNLHKPLPSLPRSTKKEIYNIPERFDFNLGKTTPSLNERFSSRAPQAMNEPSGSRTIFVE